MEKTSITVREQLNKYIAKHANFVMLIGVFLSFVMILTIWSQRGFRDQYVYINIATFFFFLAMILFRERLKVSGQMKWVIVIVTPIGVEIIYRSGFYGNGIYLILVASVLAIAFWNFYAGITVFLIGLAVSLLVYFQVVDGRLLEETMNAPAGSPELFAFQIVGFVMVVAAMFTVFYSTRLVMSNNITELNDLVVELRETNEEVERMAFFDPLTKLPNRYYFKKELSEHIEKENSYTMLIVDIKGFHHVNTFLGTDVGDAILKEIGECIRTEEGAYFFSAYLGNNKFAFLYNQIMAKEDLMVLLDKQKDFFNDRLDVPIRLEVNSVCIPDISQFEDYDTTIGSVDSYLLMVKNTDDYDMFYYDENDKEVMESISNKRLVNEAIEEKLFQVHFQEKVNSDTEEVIGLEALARLIMKDKFMSPGVFIPIIESSNRNVDFGWIIVKKTLGQYQKIVEKYGKEMIVSINVSAEFLSSLGFHHKLRTMMEEFSIPDGTVELEITESMIIENFDHVLSVINELRKDGIRIAIDDFGTGYSSLQYFSTLPIDVVKIDKSFIDKIDSDEITKAIIESIIGIAKVARVEVVAEGVEENHQSELLSEMGCKHIQGFLFSKPKPIELT